MTQPVRKTSEPGNSAHKPFVFNKDDVTLREELHLTEKQRFQAANFFKSDWNHEFIDVLPTTIVVHRELAEKKLDIRRCVFITGINPDQIAVYAAPRFCCRKPTDRAAFVPLCNSFVNMEKCDLNVIKPSETAPPMPSDFDKRTCSICNKRDDERVERSLFALGCGHFACRRCWLNHCSWALAREFCPVPCIDKNGDCNETLSVTRASTLLSDLTIAMILELEWRHKLRQPDNLQCAGCKHWLERSNFYRKVMSSGCACGVYTCVRCGQLEHSPLRCRDAVIWSEIRARETEDEQASEAEKVWSLSREDFDECLAPIKEVASEEYKANIRFMKTNDKAHGKMLERDMPMVARMLEMRRAQQLAQRKEMVKSENTYYSDAEPAERWEQLEKRFFDGLDTVGSTKEKAVYLDRAREFVLYYYNF